MRLEGIGRAVGDGASELAPAEVLPPPKTASNPEAAALDAGFDVVYSNASSWYLDGAVDAVFTRVASNRAP